MVGIADACVLAILTRAPSSGGKSRLFSAMGRAPDPDLLRALLLDTLEGAATPGVVQVVAVEPAAGCDEVRALVPAAVTVMPQGTGNLGERMRAVMSRLCQRGARRVALIGSDLPDITSGPIARTFALLDADPRAVVLGPALDGGYYLVAAIEPPDVFDGIEWGSSRVLAQTMAAATRARLNVHLLQPMADVDTIDDLHRLAGPRTRHWVQSHGGVDGQWPRRP